MTESQIMRHFAFLSVSLMALAACDPVAILRGTDAVDEPEISCLTQPGCYFDQAPVRVVPREVIIPRRPYKFFPTAQPLTFSDSRGRTWVAPAGTLTDGASIPRIFVSIVGDPTSPEFISAAAVHDAYCGIGNEEAPNFQKARWEHVHIMFYDGLIEGGTNEFVAKLMFAAVWLGGPRWAYSDQDMVVSTQGQREAYPIGGGGSYVRRLDHVPVGELQNAMRSTKRYIETSRPTLPQLLAFLRMQEDILLERFPVSPHEPYPEVREEPYKEEPYEPEYPEEPYEPEVTEPEVTEPEVTEPVVTEPDVTEPVSPGPDGPGTPTIGVETLAVPG
ncbi:DUF1353 domain-containing protein [Pseudoponticoccus marisrubri]|uniref:DUF1353 domain-containing protein n=1 Tax=Pseudoponticoccus marisrubri TaxID=1685382 RepID=A0A0W7WNQ7_9RHOB|nr:DUF1353 domain-containing protein [Pseudoponticoccus marisrubri]KUF12186.1 hypothetical protein AVJ23_00150 [Pseudoponticoccus marisrubri]